MIPTQAGLGFDNRCRRLSLVIGNLVQTLREGVILGGGGGGGMYRLGLAVGILGCGGWGL